MPSELIKFGLKAVAQDETTSGINSAVGNFKKLSLEAKRSQKAVTELSSILNKAGAGGFLGGMVGGNIASNIAGINTGAGGEGNKEEQKLIKTQKEYAESLNDFSNRLGNVDSNADKPANTTGSETGGMIGGTVGGTVGYVAGAALAPKIAKVLGTVIGAALGTAIAGPVGAAVLGALGAAAGAWAGGSLGSLVGSYWDTKKGKMTIWDPTQMSSGELQGYRRDQYKKIEGKIQMEKTWDKGVQFFDWLGENIHQTIFQVPTNKYKDERLQKIDRFYEAGKSYRQTDYNMYQKKSLDAMAYFQRN